MESQYFVTTWSFVNIVVSRDLSVYLDRMLHRKYNLAIRSPGSVQFSSVAQSCLTLCDPWTAVCQASLSITNSWSLLKLMSIELVIPSNYLIFCRPLLLLPSIFPSIRVFSNESGLHIRWPKYWSFSFSISPSSEYSGLISFRMDWLDLLAVQGKSWGMLILDNYLEVDYIGTGSNKTEL